MNRSFVLDEQGQSQKSAAETGEFYLQLLRRLDEAKSHRRVCESLPSAACRQHLIAPRRLFHLIDNEC